LSDLNRGIQNGVRKGYGDGYGLFADLLARNMLALWSSSREIGQIIEIYSFSAELQTDLHRWGWIVLMFSYIGDILKNIFFSKNGLKQLKHLKHV
jgi:hypothetical protein